MPRRVMCNPLWLLLLALPPACSSSDPGALPPCGTKAAGGRFDVNVPTITLSGALTVNGQPSDSLLGTVSLKNTMTQDTVRLGVLDDKMYTRVVVPGTYDIYYRLGGLALSNEPENNSALLKSGVSLTQTQALNVDVKSVTVSGQITVNGIAAGSSLGLVTLVNSTTGDAVFLGSTGSPTYSAALVPGTYDLYYQSTGSSTKVPNNRNALLKSGLNLTTTQALNIDIPAVTISGNLTVNNVAVDATSGDVALLSADRRDRVLLGRIGDKTYNKLIVGGTYDIYYESGGPLSTVVPANTGARLKSGIGLTTTQMLNIDTPAVTISGNLTLNGVASDSLNGSVDLYDPDTKDSVLLGRLADKTYTRLLVPGTYDAHYRFVGQDPGTTVPANRNAQIQGGVRVGSTQQINIDVKAATLSGNLTVNGAALNGPGQVSLVNSTTGDSVQLGALSDGRYARMMVPGTFDIYYQDPTPSQSGGPVNGNAEVKAGVSISGTQMLNIDVPMTPLAGNLTVNGLQVQAGQGQVYLGNPKILDTVVLGDVTDHSYTLSIVPSTYDVFYKFQSQGTGTGLPENGNAMLGCVEVARQ